LILVWKVLRQIRLKGILILLAVTYIVLLSATVLTSTSSLPRVQVAWQTTRDWAGLAGRGAVDTAKSVLAAPEEFRVAYLGHRNPVRLPGMDADDPAYLTPIPANRAARLAAGAQPTSVPSQPASKSAVTPDAEGNGSLPLPDCPHPEARLTAPRVGQVVQGQVLIEGTADIEGFDYYKFEYRREVDAEDAWHWIASYQVPVKDGELGVWNVSGLPAGTYLLRLIVVNREGNYPFSPCEVRVQITHP
jgi:hypothetical protein